MASARNPCFDNPSPQGVDIRAVVESVKACFRPGKPWALPSVVRAVFGRQLLFPGLVLYRQWSFFTRDAQ